MNNRILGLFAALVVAGTLWLGFCSPKSAGSGICVECSPTPTGEPFATAEVTPSVLYLYPQAHDHDGDCVISILDLATQAADFGVSYPNYDGWAGEFTVERERLENHDVNDDATISILDLAETAQLFGARYEPPCAALPDGDAGAVYEATPTPTVGPQT